MTFALLRLHPEEPLMTLGILSPVTTLPERRIPEFLNDLCSSPPCPVEVFINVHHIDEKTLCGLTEFSRILIARAGETHHYNIVAKHHGRVLDFPTRISIGGTALPKPESPRQEPLNGRNISVIEIRNDRHSSSLHAFCVAGTSRLRFSMQLRGQNCALQTVTLSALEWHPTVLEQCPRSTAKIPSDNPPDLPRYTLYLRKGISVGGC